MTFSLVLILIAVGLYTFLTTYSINRYAEKLFPKPSFVAILILSCIMFLAANCEHFLNNLMSSLKLALPDYSPNLIDGNDAKIKSIVAISYTLLVILWIVVFIINTHGHNIKSGILISLTQLNLCTLLIAGVYFGVPSLAPYVIMFGSLVAGVWFICAVAKAGVSESIADSRVRTLKDEHGLVVDYVSDLAGNRYYVDGRFITDSKGQRVKLSSTADSRFADEYGNLYRKSF